MDKFTPQERSRIMALVRGKNTEPEMVVRRLLHGMGYRFRLHRRDLPGCPDIVLPRHGKVVFVHGCFWHHHKGCKRATLPTTRADFWREKILKNVERDVRVLKELKREGWQALVLWECQLRGIDKVARKLQVFMSKP